MLRRPLDEQETPADHWKNRVSQKVTRVPRLGDLKPAESGSAKSRRRWMIIGRFLLVVAFFSGVGAIGWLAWDDSVAPPVRANAAARIKFETDGCLDEAWLKSKVDLAARPPLFRIKSLLEAEPQVKEVVVKRLPDESLLVKISERAPVARLLGRLPDGSTEVRLVATDGVLYRGINVGPMTFSNLPMLAGVKPKPLRSGYADVIEGFEPVAQFLTLARERHPALYREWQQISLRDYPGRPDAPGAVFRVKPRLNAQSPDSAAVVEILFSPGRERFVAEMNDLDFNMRQQFATRLREVDRSRYPAFILDMSIWNMSNPRRPYPEPRLIPVPLRQP